MSDYSSNFPQQRPTLNLDFANSGKLDSRLSYSRSSGGTYLSNEKALNSENLLLHSQDFDTGWTHNNIASPTGSQTSPAGDSTAWLLTANTATAVPAEIYQSYSVSANTEYTLVAHLKSGTASHAFVSFRNDSISQYAGVLLDFSAGTITTNGPGMTNVSSSVTALSNGWFRLTITATTGASTGSPIVQIGLSDGTAIGQYGYVAYNASGQTMYAWGVQLSTVGSTVYDSPTTTQISREYSPLLKTAAADEPRLEFDESGNSEGLLIESQRTNLATYGSDLTNAVWNPLSATAATAAIGPDGTLSAAKLTSGTGSGIYPRFRRLAFLSTSKTQTFSVYVKPLEYSYLNISQDGHSTQMVHYNLTGSGSISSSAGCSGTVEQCGNGWFRISFTHTNATSSANLAIVMQSTATYSSETGNSYDGMLFASAQLEDAAAASSFIGTTSSTVTRSADSCSVATADIPGFSEGAGTVVYETSGVASATGVQLAFTLFSAFNSYITAGVNAGGSGDTGARVYVIDPTGDQAWFNAGTATVGTGYKLACRYELDNVAASFNGGAVVSDTSGKVPVNVTSFNIGDGYASNYQLNSTIKRIALYNEALSDTNLQAITS